MLLFSKEYLKGISSKVKSSSILLKDCLKQKFVLVWNITLSWINSVIFFLLNFSSQVLHVKCYLLLCSYFLSLSDSLLKVWWWYYILLFSVQTLKNKVDENEHFFASISDGAQISFGNINIVCI